MITTAASIKTVYKTIISVVEKAIVTTIITDIGKDHVIFYSLL